MRTPHRATGMTLIELMISMTILIFVVAMTVTIVLAAVFVSRRGQEISDANEASRMAGDTVVNAIQGAGLGMSQGLYVSYAGVIVRTSPVIIVNNTNAPDELWVVRAHRNALLQSCVDEGAATTIQKSGFGAIFARCSGGLTAAGLSGAGLTAAQTLLMATNMTSGALLSTPVFTTSGAGQSLGFAESGVAGFADHPQRGFQKGDLVMPVKVEHYFIALSNGVPSLMMEPGVIGTVANGFVAAGTPRLIQSGVEDMQLSVGIDTGQTGDPANITWSNTAVGPAFVTGLRSIRVSILSLSARTILGTDGRVLLTAEYSPRTLEDHVVTAPVADGRRRTLYARRVELVNLAAGDL